MINFARQCKEAANADPAKDLAQKLFDEGWTEGRLQQALKQQPLLPDPFKITLENHLRDISRGFRGQHTTRCR